MQVLHFIKLSRLEKRVRKSLLYFEELETANLNRKELKDLTWQTCFVSTETWRNLRIATQCFLHYGYVVIEYAESHPALIPKFNALSVTHSNTSVLEAWFSLVRNMKLDSAINYGTAVGT